jgi:hypothetical protein
MENHFQNLSAKIYLEQLIHLEVMQVGLKKLKVVLSK